MVNERGGKSRYVFTPKNPNESALKEKEWRYDKMIELINKGWSQTKIAKFFNIDQSSVNKWIKRNIKPSTTTIETGKPEGIV
jgi:transposase-like protein